MNIFWRFYDNIKNHFSQSPTKNQGGVFLRTSGKMVLGVRVSMMYGFKALKLYSFLAN
jgi:hypothetical protein